MEISFDLSKRDRALAERGVDFADAAEVFAGITIDIPTADGITAKIE